MNTPRQNSPLYKFLDGARLRLEFWNTLYAAALAVGGASILAAPLVAYRATLQLGNGLLACALATMAAGLFAALALRRAVRLGQVAERLKVAAEDRDRIVSGAEFLGDDDAIKRLAVQETEQWINQDRERLSKIKIRRWPFAAAAVILLLILLWRITPGFRPLPSREQITFANSASNAAASSQNANTSSPSDFKTRSTGVAPVAMGPGPGRDAHATVLSANSPSPGPMQPTSFGGGNFPSQAPGQSSTPMPHLHHTPSGQSPVHRPYEESTAIRPGGAGHSAGGIPFVKVPTSILPPAPTHALHTTSAAPIGPSREREEIGNPTDIPTPDHAAPTDVQFTNTVIDPTELESLPPGRRELVIEYFRSMHEQASVSPTTQP